MMEVESMMVFDRNKVFDLLRYLAESRDLIEEKAKEYNDEELDDLKHKVEFAVKELQSQLNF